MGNRVRATLSLAQLVLSECPSDLSPECWNESVDAFTLSSPDIETFLYRENVAYAKFLESWASDPSEDTVSAASMRATAATHLRVAEDIKAAVNKCVFDFNLWCTSVPVTPSQTWISNFNLDFASRSQVLMALGR